MPPKPARTTLSTRFLERLHMVPMLPALAILAVGIVCGTFLATVHWWVWAAGFAVCGAAAWFCRDLRGYSAVYLTLTVLFFGAALAQVHTPRVVTPHGERLWLEVQLTDNVIVRGRSARTMGVIVPTGEKVLVGIDTMWNFEVGDRVVFRGYINPIDTVSTSYSRLMWSRGYVGRTYISRFSEPHVVPQKVKNITFFAKKLQAAATERLWRLAPDENLQNAYNQQDIAVAAAMTTGDRSGITPEIRQAYSRTGASHLLAVSGLHVGIIFLIINILTIPLHYVRRGHIAKNFIAVAAIWGYAALTGLSPSATRAAVMFSGAQVAMATSQTRNSTNIICFTAFLMLAVRPGLLFDISFQLSFVAVAAITAWFIPLYALIESRWRVLNAIWATLIVGFVASIATLPLVSHTFGVFSIVGVALNPLIISTSYFIIIFSVIWILMPVSWLEPVFRWLVGGPAWLQNRVVEAVSGVPGTAIEWQMPLWLVFAIYAAMIIFTLFFEVLSARRPRKKESVSFLDD